MVQATGEKRRSSMRTRRESARKRRHVTPEKKDPTPEPEPEPEPVRPLSPLPTKVIEGKPLPTRLEAQNGDLGPDFQSVGASGGLAASLLRSRRKLADNLFDKYWSKSGYRKKHQRIKDEEQQQEEMEKGGDKADKNEKGEQKRERMHKVGACTVTVEPHIFDVTLYMVKDKEQPQQQLSTSVQSAQSTPQTTQNHTSTSPPYPSQSPAFPPPSTSNTHTTQQPVKLSGQQPVQHSLQDPPKAQTSTQVSSQSPASAAATPSQPSAPVTQKASTPVISPPARAPSQTSQVIPSKPYVPPAPSHTQPPPRPPISSTNSTVPNHPSTPSVPPRSTTNTPSHTTHQSRPQQGRPSNPSEQKGAPDPVIHMLAQRASTDPDLKAVMKIVAAGNASEEQLKFFQRHITELTELLDARNKAAAAAGGSQSQQRPNHTPQHSAHPSSHSHNRTYQDQRYSYNASPHTPHGTPSSYHQYGYPHQQTVHRAPRPPPARPPPRPPAISALLMEFTQHSPDRYTLPKNNVVELTADGKTALVSFLVIQRGSRAEAPSHYDPVKDYYQPVTMMFRGDPKVLEVLKWYANPLEKVQKYMEGIMGKMKRAETAFLALRLPEENREGEGAENT